MTTAATTDPGFAAWQLLLAGLDPLLASHAAAALLRYRQWLDDIGRARPAGLDELFDATKWVATSRQCRPPGTNHPQHGLMLNIGTAARLAGISTRTVERRIAAGRLRVHRDGRRVLVAPADLLD